MIRKKIAMILATTLFCTTIFTGCNGGKDNAKTTGSSNVEKSVETKKDDKKELRQVLNMPLGMEPDSLNLAKVSDASSANVGAQVIEGLTGVGIENGKGFITEGMAESWEISEDKLTWTFKLRDAKWSDGVPVTAKDFVYGITRVLDPKTASPICSDIKFIKNAEAVMEGKKDISEAGIKALDEKTVEITLEYYVPYFLYIAASTPMFPVREDIVEKYGDSYGTEADKMVFCGPFILDEWVHNSKVKLRKNESYWDKDNVKLEEVNMKLIADGQATIGEFQNGGIDFIGVDSAEWIKELSKSGEYEHSKVSIPRTQYLFFNQETKIFSNEKVRKAFSVAIDRKEISHDITKDIDPDAYGWIPPSMNVEGENFRKLAGDPIKELIEEVKDPKALLIEGIKELGMGEDPSAIEIQLMCPNHGKAFAEYLQQHYKKTLGVNLVIDSVEWPVFQERNRGLDYEMGFKSYGANFNDPSSMMGLWVTGTKTVPTAWSNKEYDRLMDEASKSVDKDERVKKFIEAERILLKDDATIVPYAYSEYNRFSHKYLKDVIEEAFIGLILKHAYVEK